MAGVWGPGQPGAAAGPLDDDVDLEALPKVGGWGSEGGIPAPPGDEPEWGTVEYFGTTLRVCLDPLSLELAFEEFMDLAQQLEGTEDPRAFGVVRSFLRTIIHPDDFVTFWRLVRVNRQDTMAQMGFGKWLVEQIGGHPTGQPSGSGAGRLATAQRYEDDISSRVQERFEDQARPDLALVVLQAREAASSRG